jgi:TRAP-type C4-dicarboxylate transport system permease small subunit
MSIVPRTDRTIRAGLSVVCAVMLVAMVALTAYTVVMRTVFLDPPFWGDTVTLFANVWLVMLAFALSIRDRESIAMRMTYTYLPARAVIALEFLWTGLFVVVGAIMAWYGWELVRRVPGAYWELGNLPKSVPMAILPLSGVLVVAASLFVLVEDLRDPAAVRDRAMAAPTDFG